ncbi:M3 family oligoendopeptidase [Vagococcus xieshaowenii]|uniref:M3 family oligoendopeptidase n=1 Tax=Vagococcus xieshaowenii TaxID=2562451 RepID=A0AAJ5EE87_9ENTE|nr:M3 family oligoendopeptidase [Vagococcus xieshaowenii]QCA28090.1 M3 family oligoendopeptidase [Vagococcus xieshaowenii]TFZ40133.1 M3 family oligoendopeptidase [Vagococcus xieshaowenii]
MTYAINWDLDSIFPGGSSSPQLQARLDKLETEIQSFTELVEGWDIHQDSPTFNELTTVITAIDTISNGFSQTGSFINAIQSADVHDKKAGTLFGSLQQLSATFQNAYNTFMEKISSLTDEEWQYLEKSSLAKQQGVLFNLSEVREKGKKLLSKPEEKIINQLSIDGFNAWSSHYDTIVASLTIDYNGDTLSAGQAFNRMMGDSDPIVRAELFEIWEKTWAEKAPLFADTLNHLQGFRLANYELHNTTDFLETPLKYNRMQKETLNMMWQVITENKQLFIDFLTRKAQLFGKEKMEWQDQDAPIVLGDLEETRYTFDEAANFIIENFAKFSPKMADFAQDAFEKSWIEAEDRLGKRPGGYCTALAESQESRIFMTYGGSINEVATLAHELGHAYHSHVMWDLPGMSQDYTMNVAETASTFAELIVADATLKQAQSDLEKINLLDVKMQNAIAMFMNIHARFIFENNFHEARQSHVLSDEEITQLMLDAQKESYQDSLASYHPHFWASKLHFYIDDVPFYNFPYTFGYLFSLGIYAYAQQAEGNFEEDYISLLRDTASMTTENLAQKHLNVDLTKPDFWQNGINILKADIEEFMSLSEQYI